MKKLILGLLLLVSFNGWGQEDTLDVESVYEASEEIYGNLNQYVETGFLLNRALSDTLSMVYKSYRFSDSITDANWFYTVMNDLKFMALDTSEVPSLTEIHDSVSRYMGGKEFEELKLIYPIGIADFNFNWINETEAISNNELELINNEFHFVQGGESAFQNGNLNLIAPLYNYGSMENMGIVFGEKYFYSNYRDFNEIQSLKVVYNQVEYELGIDEVFEFTPENSLYQEFKFKVFYSNGDSIVYNSRIETPELENNDQPKSFEQSPDIGWFHEESIGKLKLKAYFIPGCNNNSVQDPLDMDPNKPPYIPMKPYILVTGFRPPIFGQSPKKTWKNYNDNHEKMLNQLRLNGYDIILVKFNMSLYPNKLGLQEASALLIKYLKSLNQEKEQHGFEYNENVIQGSSMGASIVRLALIKMEKEHFQNNNYPHHHCRLFNSYDANYYGANIPLAYQMQIYSGVTQPMPSALWFLNPYAGGAELLLRVFLYATLEQKATKELLTYHAKGLLNENFFEDKNRKRTWTPTHSPLRQAYLNEVNTLYDQMGYYPHGKLFMPLPSSTRNISISLGKISGRNNQNSQGLEFNSAGENWRNVDLGIYKHILRAGQFSSSKLIFKRKIELDLWFTSLTVVDQWLKVKNMQEIDNSAGSYLKGESNMLAVANIAYGFNWYNLFSKPKFTHKSVLSALSINKNIWPSNGSHTMDMQGLDLMYNSLSGIQNNFQSNHYGYPNLGRPNDHFEVTPFEAIYVSDYILPHIKYEVLKPDEIAEHVTPINDFIKSEVEPCYLYLQNQNLGAQARSNYTYKAKRRANNTITTGYNITPATDPGHFNVEPNAQLILEAGEQITLDPGTHALLGSRVHIKIHYEACPERPRPCGASGMIINNSSNDYGEAPSEQTVNRLSNEKTEARENTLIVYPNPTTDDFSIVSEDAEISKFLVYNINGQLLNKKENLKVNRYKYTDFLEQGSYILIIHTADGNIHHRKIIRL